MKRRGFLASLLAGAGALAGAKRAQAEPQAPQPLPEPEPVERRVRASVLPTGPGLLHWREAVAQTCELPILADEGDACFVESEDRIYIAIVDEREEKLVDVSREELRAGYEELKSEAATKAYVDGVARRVDFRLYPPGFRRPGHWIPMAGAGL